MQNIHYKRVLIKLSGEVLSGTKQFGIDYKVVSDLAHQIKEIHDKDIEIGIVIGAGNIFRGVSSEGEEWIVFQEITLVWWVQLWIL